VHFMVHLFFVSSHTFVCFHALSLFSGFLWEEKMGDVLASQGGHKS
jgi:hypothetical protein